MRCATSSHTWRARSRWRRSRSAAADSLIVLSYDPEGVVASEEVSMRMVKIRIANQPGRADALLRLMRRGQVVCFPEDVYVVPEAALGVLRSSEVTFQELEPDVENAWVGQLREWVQSHRPVDRVVDGQPREHLRGHGG